MNKRTITLAVVAIAGIVLGIVATSLLSPHPAPAAEPPIALDDGIPPHYLKPTTATELEFRLVSVAPEIQLVSEACGLKYSGYFIDDPGGIVCLKFWSTTSAWNRNLPQRIKAAIGYRFLYIDADVWAFRVVDSKAGQFHEFLYRDGGVWRTKTLGKPAK